MEKFKYRKKQENFQDITYKFNRTRESSKNGTFQKETRKFSKNRIFRKKKEHFKKWIFSKRNTDLKNRIFRKKTRKIPKKKSKISKSRIETFLETF